MLRLDVARGRPRSRRARSVRCGGSRISCRPAFVSNRQRPPFSTIGIGIGQSSAPTIRVATSRVVGIPRRPRSSRGPARRRRWLWFLSWTGSSVTTRSMPSGPRISFKRRHVEVLGGGDQRLRSPPPGVANVFCCRWLRSRRAAGASTHGTRATAPSARRAVVPGRRAHRAHLLPPPPPPPPPRPPPPRRPMLDAPRELLARALDPL